MRSNTYALLFALALCSVLLSCGGSAAPDVSALRPEPTPQPALPVTQPVEPEQAPPGLPALPAPNDLPREASTVDEDRWMIGYYYNPNLPNNLVAQQGVRTWLEYSPNWDPASPTTASDMAWAIHGFWGFDTFTGPAQLYTHWKDIAPADVWLGLANFETGRWDWFHSAEHTSPNVGSLVPYTRADGAVFVASLVLGTTQGRLRSLLFGDVLPPDARLISDVSNSPANRHAPLTVNFDAENSVPRGSDIVQYEMDFQGDGFYDAFGPNPLFDHVYNTPGVYQATLRVTDALGQTETDIVEVHVINPNNQAPTASFTPTSSNGTAPRNVTFDASASSDPDGNIIEYWWDFDNDGDWDRITTSPLIIRNFSNFGDTTVRLRVVDNDLATAQTTGTVSCTNGWRHHELTDTSYFIHKPSVTVQGSGATARPCVAYVDASNLKFIRGANNNGTSWGSPLVLDGPAAGVYTKYGCSLAIDSVSQIPRIAYGTSSISDNTHELRFVSATSTTGASWNLPVTVSNEPGTGNHLDLVESGGRWVISDTVWGSSYVEGQTANLRVLRSSDGTGSSWELVKTLQTVGIDATIRASSLMAVPGGNPLLAWSSDSDSLGTQHWFSLASSADGADWSTPMPLPLGDGHLYEHELELGYSAAAPLYISSGSTDGKLWYNRSANTEGSSWPNSPGWLSEEGTASSATIGIVAGKPAVAYMDETYRVIRYITSADAEGTGWFTPHVVTAQNNPGRYLALTVLPNDVPLIIYENATTRKLMAAVFF